MSKVGEIFGSHEPEQRKIMMTIASRINELARGIQDTKVESIDWDMWTERYTSIGCAALGEGEGGGREGGERVLPQNSILTLPIF